MKTLDSLSQVGTIDRPKLWHPLTTVISTSQELFTIPDRVYRCLLGGAWYPPGDPAPPDEEAMDIASITRCVSLHAPVETMQNSMRKWTGETE